MFVLAVEPYQNPTMQCRSADMHPGPAAMQRCLTVAATLLWQHDWLKFLSAIRLPGPCLVATRSTILTIGGTICANWSCLLLSILYWL
jgi:hypothetical protein